VSKSIIYCACRYTDADPKWLWVDPMCTFIFAISVIMVTKNLVVDITRDLMEAVPANIDIGSLLEKMKDVTGVAGVHDLHVWRVGTGKVILTAHADVSGKTPSYEVIRDLENIIARAGIAHSTVQLCLVSPEADGQSGETPTRLKIGPASGSGFLQVV
jgi:Co/Zn/Cd efflux system component